MDSLKARAAHSPPVPARARRKGRPGVVIVGAGRAGWQMAEALRQRDPEVPITIVASCEADIYDKPLLSVAMARQLAPAQLVKERGVDAARRLGVRLLHTHPGHPYRQGEPPAAHHGAAHCLTSS